MNHNKPHCGSPADSEKYGNALNDRLAHLDAGRLKLLSVVFRDATRLEADFWQMGLDLS